jgi:hypothetical protein
MDHLLLEHLFPGDIFGVFHDFHYLPTPVTKRKGEKLQVMLGSIDYQAGSLAKSRLACAEGFFSRAIGAGV